MSIEEDIKQPRFRSEHQKAIINILFTYNWLANQHKPIFESEGLTMQQFNILRILRGSKEPLSTLQIRERMLDKMSDTSRIVDRLVIKGYVKKIVCKQDKRLVDVTITEAGRKVLARMDKQDEKMDSIISSISATEAKQLSKLLDKMRNSK